MKAWQRILQLFAVGLIAAAPAYAQAGRDADPDKAVAGGGTLPEGWAARTDRDAPLTNVKFAKMGAGWHVTLGPAVVLYRDADKASGNYKAVATFAQTKAPAHPEGYGLVVGGSDLSGAGQQYTYFLVRGDGKFLVKRRTGATTSNVTTDWTASDAVTKADDAGKAKNELAVAVNGGKASFSINGKEVYSADASKIDANGIVGIRVNHNLDVHVDGPTVTKM